MQLKILLEKIQEEVSKNPDILELEVYIQDIDSDIHKMRSVNIGHGTANSFVVEEFYKDPQTWLSEMGSDFTTMKDFINSDENIDMKAMFYFKSEG